MEKEKGEEEEPEEEEEDQSFFHVACQIKILELRTTIIMIA